LLFRQKSMLAVYGLLAITLRVALAYSPDVERMSAVLNRNGDAALLFDSIRDGLLPYVALVMWVMYPLGYFGLIAQRFAVNRGSLLGGGTPESVLDALRNRGDADGAAHAGAPYGPAGTGRLELVEAGAQTAPDRDEVSYLWYNLREREDGRVHSGYRVVRLIELRFLPQEARNDAGLVSKTRAAVTGLYDVKARFDLVQVVAGIFAPPLASCSATAWPRSSRRSTWPSSKARWAWPPCKPRWRISCRASLRR